MTQIQSPQVLTDLYRDLRDRRLLPLVVVLVVGMAIVPIALSSSPGSPAPTLPPPPAVAANSNAPKEEIVVANPGVRDYQRRLDGDSPADPFVQKFVSPSGADAAADSAGSASAGGGSEAAGLSETTSSASIPPDPATPTGGAPVSQPQPQTQSRFFFYRVKVRSGQVGGEMKTRESVGNLTPLPSQAIPALVYMGVTTDRSFQADSAVFLVSSSVSSIEGQGKCTFAGDTCQLLTLEPGEYADLVWTNGLKYRVSLVKFDLISRKELPSEGGQGSSPSQRASGRDRSPGGYFSF